MEQNPTDDRKEKMGITNPMQSTKSRRVVGPILSAFGRVRFNPSRKIADDPDSNSGGTICGVIAKLGKGGRLKTFSLRSPSVQIRFTPLRSRGVVRPIIGVFRRGQSKAYPSHRSGDDNQEVGRMFLSRVTATKVNPGRGFKSHREHP